MEAIETRTPGTGKRRHGGKEALIRVTITINSNLKNLLDELNIDPLTKRPTYGYLSQLIDELLFNYCKKNKLFPTRRKAEQDATYSFR